MFSTPKESWELKHSFVAHRVSRKFASGIFRTTAGILKHHSISMKEAGLLLVQLFHLHHQGSPWPQASKQTEQGRSSRCWGSVCAILQAGNLGSLVPGVTQLFSTASWAAEDRLGGR